MQNFDQMLSLSQTNEKIKKEHLFFDEYAYPDNPCYLVDRGLNLGGSINEDRNLNCKEQFSREDLKAEIITFTAATLDGVSALVSPFFNNIFSHPSAYNRLVEEIRHADRAGRLSRPVVTYEETLQLPFLMACVKETLRCDAPAQTILPRLVNDGGYELYDGKMYIPAGTLLGASPYIIHRDEAVFGLEPNVWKPERWIREESGMGDTEHAAYVRKMEKYGMWWGYGARECVGKFYGLMEVHKLCVELLRRFDIQVVAGDEEFTHERWAVGMFWNQKLSFTQRV